MSVRILAVVSIVTTCAATALAGDAENAPIRTFPLGEVQCTDGWCVQFPSPVTVVRSSEEVSSYLVVSEGELFVATRQGAVGHWASGNWSPSGAFTLRPIEGIALTMAQGKRALVGCNATACERREILSGGSLGPAVVFDSKLGATLLAAPRELKPFGTVWGHYFERVTRNEVLLSEHWTTTAKEETQMVEGAGCAPCFVGWLRLLWLQDGAWKVVDRAPGTTPTGEDNATGVGIHDGLPTMQFETAGVFRHDGKRWVHEKGPAGAVAKPDSLPAGRDCRGRVCVSVESEPEMPPHFAMISTDSGKVWKGFDIPDEVLAVPQKSIDRFGPGNGRALLSMCVGVLADGSTGFVLNSGHLVRGRPGTWIVERLPTIPRYSCRLRESAAGMFIHGEIGDIILAKLKAPPTPKGQGR